MDLFQTERTILSHPVIETVFCGCFSTFLPVFRHSSEPR